MARFDPNGHDRGLKSESRVFQTIGCAALLSTHASNRAQLMPRNSSSRDVGAAIVESSFWGVNRRSAERRDTVTAIYLSPA
jgi:hypothetical protein